MKPSTRIVRWPISAALLALTAISTPTMAGAKCSASDFEVNQVMSISKDVESTVENLMAVTKNAPKDAHVEILDIVRMAAAAKDIQSSFLSMTHFFSLVFLSSEMANRKDQQAVEKYIALMSSQIYTNLKAAADYYSINPGDELHPYGEPEVREARDVLRKMQSQFSCAAETG